MVDQYKCALINYTEHIVINFYYKIYQTILLADRVLNL